MSADTDVLERAPRVRYDHHTPDYARNHRVIAEDMLENSPVAWSDAYGGFWVVSRYEDARHVFENWQLFSSENRISQGDYTRRGCAIPPIGIEFPLNEVDPPVHTRRRMLEAPFFTPKYLGRWAKAAEEFTTLAIDDVIEKGECDLLRDICGRIPVMTTLFLGGADPGEWQFYSDPRNFHGTGDEHNLDAISLKLKAIIEDRRRNPRDDMASVLANAKVDGEPLEDKIAIGMLHTIVTGGFDTAISVLCDALEWLEANPGPREYLRAHPEATENAAEEFLRMWPPVSNIARTATQDMELGGRPVKAGDWVLVSVYAANHDPAKFPDPFEVRLDRENARDHLAFTAGNHRCLGAPLGKIEIRHVINEILRRMPDYRIDRAKAKRRDTMGLVKGWETLPVAFTPGRREGA